MQAIVYPHQFPVTTGHNGQVVGWVTDFGKLPINEANPPFIPSIMAQYILRQQISGQDARQIPGQNAERKARKEVLNAIKQSRLWAQPVVLKNELIPCAGSFS